MDHFGIGHAMKAMVRVYIQGARQSGRTTSLLESLKDGDRIVCAMPAHAKDLKRRCRERGLHWVDVVVIEPKRAQDELFHHPTSPGRTVFDHAWVELYYQHVLERAAADIDFLQRETSGFGTAHIETREEARQLQRWSGT